MKKSLALAIVACLGCAHYNSSQGELSPSVNLDVYRYMIVDASSPSTPTLTRVFIEKGFMVMVRALESLDKFSFAPNVLLWAKCTDLGEIKKDLGLASTQRVSCQILDAASRKIIYNGIGEHAGMSHKADQDGAAENAIQKLPTNGHLGGVTEVFPAEVFRPRQ